MAGLHESENGNHSFNVLVFCPRMSRVLAGRCCPDGGGLALASSRSAAAVFFFFLQRHVVFEREGSDAILNIV